MDAQRPGPGRSPDRGSRRAREICRAHRRCGSRRLTDASRVARGASHRCRRLDGARLADCVRPRPRSRRIPEEVKDEVRDHPLRCLGAAKHHHGLHRDHPATTQIASRSVALGSTAVSCRSSRRRRGLASVGGRPACDTRDRVDDGVVPPRASRQVPPTVLSRAAARHAAPRGPARLRRSLCVHRLRTPR